MNDMWDNYEDLSEEVKEILDEMEELWDSGEYYESGWE